VAEFQERGALRLRYDGAKYWTATFKFSKEYLTALRCPIVSRS
jgi:hypothetical protein